MKKNISLILFTSLLSFGIIGCNSNQEDDTPIDIPLREVSTEEFLELALLTKNYPQIYKKINASRTITSSKGDMGIHDKDLYGDLEYFRYSNGWSAYNYNYREIYNTYHQKTLSYYAEKAKEDPSILEGVTCYIGNHFEAHIHEEYENQNEMDYTVYDHIISDMILRADLRGNITAWIVDTQNVDMEYTTHDEWAAEYTFEQVRIKMVDTLDEKDMKFSYNSGTDSYTFLGNHRNIWPNTVIIPDYYDDGVHGTAKVDKVDLYALSFQKNLAFIFINKYIDTFDINYVCAGRPFSKMSSRIVSIDVDDENKVLYSTNGILFRHEEEGAGDTLLFCSTRRHFDNDEYVVPEGVTSIAEYAFSYNDFFNKITFPNSLETISYSAFYDCGMLKEIVWGEGIKRIDDNAFTRCPLGPTLVLPDSCEHLYNSFIQLDFLEELTLGKDFKSLFGGFLTTCHKLKKINYNGTSDVLEHIFRTSFMQRSWFPVDTVYCLDGEVNLDEIFNNENNQN